ncbi:hypothetical protein LCGC14_1305710 [marine sediment metagenome]|uniref:Uncharacterized protein n=1 Tax=marine sediment metagenome TaxID=412755 RepID=A0A0F9KPG9_9ZZZZ
MTHTGLDCFLGRPGQGEAGGWGGHKYLLISELLFLAV